MSKHQIHLKQESSTFLAAAGKKMNADNIKHFVLVTGDKSKATNALLEKTLQEELFGVKSRAVGSQPTALHKTAMFHSLLGPQRSDVHASLISSAPTGTAPMGAWQNSFAFYQQILNHLQTKLSLLSLLIKND